MLTKLWNILQTTRRQVYTSAVSRLPKLSGAELARSSWAKPIKSYADVPNVYKDFFDSFLADGQIFPYTVLTPSHERFIHRQSEKLISDFGHKIYILEREGNAFQAQCYPVDEISYIEFRTALLASSIKISGRTSHGTHTTSTLMFNSVTDYLFTPILRSVRLAKIDYTDVVKNSASDQFDHLIKINYKFMNFAKHSLLAGDRVVHSILQPEIRESKLTVLDRWYYKTISPTHMSILTDRELILIREDAVRRKEDKYGGIWDYIPLNKIISLSVSENNDNLLVLTVQLPENIFFELLFQASAKGEIKQLLDRFRKLNKRRKI
jgi:hypothetical protein